MDPEYFSDSLQLSDMDDNKKAGEKLQGFWIVEIQELAGMKKADIEKVKGFISSTDDKYRASYGHHVERHPRKCVIFATVNGEQGYLRDLTGNRRFWVIKINSTNTIPNFRFDKTFKDQLWAEARHYYVGGEPLFLDEKFLEIAAEYQNNAMEHDDRTGIVEKYLDELLPDNWDECSIADSNTTLKIITLRCIVSSINVRDCPIEIWVECSISKADFNNKESNAIQIRAQIPGG